MPPEQQSKIVDAAIKYFLSRFDREADALSCIGIIRECRDAGLDDEVNSMIDSLHESSGYSKEFIHAEMDFHSDEYDQPTDANGYELTTKEIILQ